MTIKSKFVCLSLISILLSSCVLEKRLDEIEFNDFPLFVKQTSSYEGFFGAKNIYILWGSYQGIKSGQCINTQGQKHVFSISRVLHMFPSLQDAKTLKAAEAQQVQFKKTGSKLLEKDATQGTGNTSPGKQP